MNIPKFKDDRLNRSRLVKESIAGLLSLGWKEDQIIKAMKKEYGEGQTL